jgi:hypothetical protein
MLDDGDFAIRNVWIDRNLRRRRSGNRIDVARHDGDVDVGNVSNIGDIVDLRNLSHVGVVDNVRHAEHIRIDGYVRLGLGQRRLIVDPDFDDAYSARRRCSNRPSVGLCRDRQSRS